MVAMEGLYFQNILNRKQNVWSQANTKKALFEAREAMHPNWRETEISEFKFGYLITLSFTFSHRTPPSNPLGKFKSV